MPRSRVKRTFSSSRSVEGGGRELEEKGSRLFDEWGKDKILRLRDKGIWSVLSKGGAKFTYSDGGSERTESVGKKA